MKRFFAIVIHLLFFSEIVCYSHDFNTTLKLAQQGDTSAQRTIGDMYKKGVDIKQDYTQAFYWYSKAAEAGNLRAQNSLGVLYATGRGIAKNHSQAQYWFLKASKQGYAKAQYNLGKMYEEGNGVEQNYKTAEYWYLLAANKGHVKAQCALGNLYREGKGVLRDYSQAFHWYNKAAEQESVDGQICTGNMHYYGYGTKQDYSKALHWYKKAAAQGDANAQYNVGIMYEQGEGTPQNFSEAMRWYKKAANDNRASLDAYNRLAALGYKEAPEPLLPLLELVDGSIVFKDASNNNQIEVGEQCSVRFKVRNIGKGPANNCDTRVKLNAKYTGLIVQNVKLPTIQAGQTYDVIIPITTDINTKDGQATISIEVFEPNGWGVAPFDLTITTKSYEPPLLQVVDYNIVSTSGKIKKMEPFTLTFNLQNTKYGDAKEVEVKVKLPYNVYIMDGSAELSFPLIKSGEAKSISLTLAVNNNYPTTNIPITIDIKEKYGKFAENKQLDIALNQTAGSSITIAAKEEPKQERKEIQLATLTADVDRNIPQTDTQNKNTFVLIIANENYQSVASVPFAINDGKIFRQYCEQTLGIPTKNIHAQANATGNQIKAQINWLSNVVEVFDNPNIIFYYAGHGIPDEASKTAYLLPVDGLGTDVSTGYKLDDLYATLGNMPASRITVFMDACFSGSKREEGMLAEARGVALKAKSGVPQGNMVVFSAAQGNETAYPNKEKQHGLFTYYLLKKLQQTGGDVSLQDLGDYIITNVKQQSVLLNSKLQTPCVTSSSVVADSWQSWKLK